MDRESYVTDPITAARRIRGVLLEHDGVRFEVPSPAVAEAITARLTPLERCRVALVWPDYPMWDVDGNGDPIEMTHNALRRQ